MSIRGLDMDTGYATESARTLSDVREFWNTEACGTHFVDEDKGTREFYEKYRRIRYQSEWHIPLIVPFAEGANKRVLEIGCGNGADGSMFALNGASYTGVDLTDEAVEATRKHFGVLGLAGTFQTENAERLSFPTGTFDMVYSHGVLHHTPVPQRAIDEVYRVLKPGGKAVIMLYHKNSFNYYIRIMGYMRARVIAYALSRMGRWEEDRRRLSSSIVGARGNQGTEIWHLHYLNFLRDGWSYLSPANFVHHATDGPECPYAFAYSRGEAQQLFSRFQDVSMKVAHFPLRKYTLGRWVPKWLEGVIARRIGWYLFIYAVKPEVAQRS